MKLRAMKKAFRPASAINYISPSTKRFFRANAIEN